MPGDYSRFTYDEKNRYSAVLEHQGRVRVDADFNEAMAIALERERKLAKDIVGPAAVPRATSPDAFKLTSYGGDLRIGVGRMYVDGLVAENFTTVPNPVRYLNQPFYPDPPAIPARGLAYLDVWEREITAVQDPDLPDVALGGLDTTTRIQTVWQVKIASNAGLNCKSDLNGLFPPSLARLTVKVAAPGADPDPCRLPLSGGYRDVENHLYRVEFHGGTSPQLKFYRDPIASGVTKLTNIIVNGNDQTILELEQIGRDSVLRFRNQDQVEFLTERRVLRNEPGILARIVGVNDATNEVTLDVKIDQAELGTRSWLTVWHGVKPLVAGDIALESGISVTITGTPHHGDYWNFAARAATHDVEQLVNAPPRGVDHHYAPLAMVRKLDGHALVDHDCRTIWPPECDCECASCVNPEDHASGEWTIQMAIDKVGQAGGGKICLKPGAYFFEQPLLIRDLHDVHLTGHGEAVLIYIGGAEQALLIERSNDIVVEQIVFVRAPGLPEAEVGIIEVRVSAYGVIIRRCFFRAGDAAPANRECIAIVLDRVVHDVRILDNLIFSGGVGVSSRTNPATKGTRLFLCSGVEIRGNSFICSNAGIRLLTGGIAVHIRDNAIRAEESCIRLEGTTVPGTANIIDGNWVAAGRGGIGSSCDRTHITNNVIRGRYRLEAKPEVVPFNETYSSIALFSADDSAADLLEQCLVAGNHCLDTLGMGVQVAVRVKDLLIKQNFIHHTAAAGIFVKDRASGSHLVIENNEIRETALGYDGTNRLWGIRLAPDCEADVSANTIANVGTVGSRATTPDAQGVLRTTLRQAAAIIAEVPRRVRIHENVIRDVAPAVQVEEEGRFSALASAAIEITGTFGIAEVTNNDVQVQGALIDDERAAHCYALRSYRPSGSNATPPETDYTVVTLPYDFVSDQSRLAAPVRRAFQSATYVIFWPYPVIPLGPATELLLVRANVFQVFGVVDPELGIVVIGAPTMRTTFGGNFCVNRAAGNTTLKDGVLIAGETTVCDSNQIFGWFERGLHIHDLPKLGLWTIVGNIVQGRIWIEFSDTALGTWSSVNRVTA